jgi:predicted RecA/RadA family phage recombinase
MSVEAIFAKDGGVVDYTPSVATGAGEVVTLADGRVAVCLRALAANELGSAKVDGHWYFPSASGTTFAKGTLAWWDVSANLAITAPGEAADIPLGIVEVAKVSGETTVLVNLGTAIQAYNCLAQSRVIEFDCETGVEINVYKDLLPAAWNKTGLIIKAIYGLVTEVFGGSSQDQGIVTVKDTADNVPPLMPPAMSSSAPERSGAQPRAMRSRPLPQVPASRRP